MGIILWSLSGYLEYEPPYLITYAEFNQLAEERPLEQPPVWFKDAADNLHYLSYQKSDYLTYQILDLKGQPQKKLDILLPAGRLDYFFAIGEVENSSEFIFVQRADGLFQAYLLSIDGEEATYQKLPLTIANKKDIDGLFNEYYYFAFAKKTDEAWELIVQMLDQHNLIAEKVVARADGFIGLPRLLLDQKGILHLSWKENRGAAGVQKYNRLDSESLTILNAENIDLGPATIHFGDRFGQPLLFDQDIGANLVESPSGDIFVSYTYVYWETFFNILQAYVNLIKISPQGEIIDKAKITGKNDFALSGKMAISDSGQKIIIWEDYVDQSFNLQYYLSDSFADINQKHDLMESFAANRLVSVGWAGEELILFFRQLKGPRDRIVFVSEALLGAEKWYDRWNLWFFREGFVSIFRESLFILLFSLFAAGIYTAGNALLLFIFMFVFYLMQKFNLLNKFRFFTIILTSIALIYFCKIKMPSFYASAEVSSPFLFYASFIALLIILIKSYRIWHQKIDELTLLSYIVLWIFTDLFLSFLFYAPKIFAP